MVVQQRYAAFRLAVALSTLGVFGLVAERVGPWRGQAAFALFALLALEPLTYRWRRHRTPWDERDHALHLRAIQWGMGAFWVVFSVGIWVGYQAAAPTRMLPVEVLPLVAWLATATFLLCNAAAVLLVYRLS